MTQRQDVRVSVVIPAFNAADFIERAVESVYRQDCRPIELIVVDDASEDETAAIVERAFERAPSGVRTLLLRGQVNMGAARALAVGFEAASGEYVCWLSADDEYCDRAKVSRQVKRMVSTGEDLTYFRAALVGPSLEDARVVTSSYLPRLKWLNRWIERSPRLRLFMLMFANPLNGSSVMIRSSVLRRYGGLDGDLGNVDADGDLWMRYSALGLRFGAIDGASVFYRQHQGQTSANREAMGVGMALTRLRMLRVIEEVVGLRRATGFAWLFLPLLSHWGMYRLCPVAASYLAERIADSSNGFGVTARVFARRMLERMHAEGLPNAPEGNWSSKMIEEAARTATFLRFREQLEERWRNRF